jgi:hypothetical protein
MRQYLRTVIRLPSTLATLGVLAAVLLAACGSSQGSTEPPAEPTVEPTPTVVPTVVPETPSPSPSDTWQPVGLGPDGFAMVVTNDLVVRSLPEISDRSTIDPDYLQNGQLLFVLDGPVAADGYAWYRVAPFSGGSDVVYPAPLLGWVAASGKDGEPWIASATEWCSRPEGNPYWRVDYGALACVGGRDVVIEGTLAGCSDIVRANVEPVWLAHGGCAVLPDGWEQGELGNPYPTFHVPPNGPDLPRPDANARIRIVGHLDDPAARGCRVAESSEDDPPPEIVVLNCRAALVVTEITPLDG